MRILQLSAVKSWGGGENHIENLCLELSQSHPEVENLIFCVREGKFYQKLKKTDLQYVTAPLAIKIDPRYAYKLANICCKKSIDLIHIHDSTALTLAVMADKFWNLPPFVFSKKTSFPIKDRKQTLFKYNYHKIRKILCVSDITRDITAQSIYSGIPLQTIYHGTNLSTKSDHTPFLLREKYKIPPAIKIVGNIANHIRAKNLETFIEMAHEIVNVQKREEFIFVQFGDFTERTPALKKKIMEYGLEEKLLLMGFVANASNFIPQFDIMVMTSQSEGVPGVLFEAFYHKTPVVSTDVGGIPEIITHNENGFLAPPHQPQQLAHELLRLTNDPELRKSFTETSHQRLLHKFTTAKMADNTLTVYKELLDER